MLQVWTYNNGAIVQLLKQVNYILASNHEFLFATFIKWNFAFTSEYPWPKQDS